MIGRTLSHYQIVEKLGEGGMGVVYKARDARLDRFVAIKVLPAERVADPERKRRFVQEAKAASALNHPNIVVIYDIDQADGVDFIAMEFIAGKPLDEILARRPIRLNDALSYSIQIAGALAAAHAAGIVHRDLKPSNVMVTPEGQVKLLDFGLAKLTAPPSRPDSAVTATVGPKTESGVIVGTVAYMSPEQAEGLDVDARSDVFSFGLLLYEMLTHQHPFRRESRIATLSAIVNESPRPMREISATLAPEVERTVMRCLHKEPHRRWQGMPDLKSVLEDLKEESESGSLRGPGAAVTRRRAPWILVGGLSLALVAAVAAFVVWRMRTPAAGSIELTRLTLDSGFTGSPAVSRDGRIMAYSSDREGGGPSDIWVRHLDRPQPTRRTHEPLGAWAPSISPDGSRIVYSSGREGGGLYIMDTLGGEARKIASHLVYPRFSPDGKLISAVRPSPTLSPVSANKMFLVSPDGGDPKSFQPDFGVFLLPQSTGPVWSPDSRQLLFKGAKEGAKGADWYVAPIDGGAPVSTGVAKTYPQTSGVHGPAVWLANDQLLAAEGFTIEGVNLFRLSISPKDWQITGRREQLTSGPGMRFSAAATEDGRILFPILNWIPNIWAAPIDANSGRLKGPLEPVTADATTKVGMSVSRDGTKAAYAAFASLRPVPRYELRLREVISGKEAVLVDNTGLLVAIPLLNTDGSLAAFREQTPSGVYAAISSTTSGERRHLCANCRITAFFADRKSVLVQNEKGLLVRQEIEGGGAKVLADPAPGVFTNARLSDDGRWIVLCHELPGRLSAVYVVPVKDSAAPRTEWVEISLSETSWHSEPGWSPDGKLVYFVSERDGTPCIWARRFDPVRRVAEGEVFAVHHLHGFHPSFWGPRGFHALSITRDRIFLLAADTTSNIWMARLP